MSMDLKGNSLRYKGAIYEEENLNAEKEMAKI